MASLRKINKRTPQLNIHLYQWLIFIGLTAGLWLKGFYTQFSIKINDIPIFHEDNYPMFWISLAMVIFVMSILCLLSWPKPLLLPWAGAIFLGFLMLADTIYGRYYYNPVSMSILDQLYMASDVTGSIKNLFKPKDIIFILDFLAIGLFSAFIKVNGVLFSGTYSPLRRRIALLMLCLLSGGAFFFGYSQTDTTNYAYERKYMARDLGLLYYHGYDFGEYVERQAGKHDLTAEEKALIESSNGYSTDSPYSGAAEGYNLIVIQMEAIMDFLIDYEVDGKPVMPYLSSLKEESLYLSNCYVQTANGNTVDAELMMNTSLLPAPTGSVYYGYPTNTFESLPRLLKEKGYAVNSFHAYDASFWNREVMHKTLGFDRFYSYDDFVIDEKIGWSLTDASFLRQSLAFTNEVKGEKPFYSFMVTLTSHHPYDGITDGPFTGSKGTEGVVNWYYNGANYVDGVLKHFVDELKAQGLYDNTILVIYGDHNGLFGEEAIQQCNRDGVPSDSEYWIKYYQVPAIVHAPGLLDDGVLIKDATGQIDIMPTVADLMGLEGLYTLGHNVLADDYEGLVARRYGEVMTDDFIYLPEKKNTYDSDTSQVIDQERYQSQIDAAHMMLEVNDLILKGDWFDDRK